MPNPVKQGLAAGSALLFLGAAAWQGWEWRRAGLEQAALAEFASGRDIGPERRFGAPPPVRLAYALWLARQERLDEAREVLAELGDRGPPEFRARVAYDLGNLYLRQALAEVDRGQTERAVPLAELAKDAYRRALRFEPGFWDAKYNLETATRLSPDFDPVDQGSEAPEQEATRKLWTRVPGLPRGLP
ncbi:MxaK protein [Candidatus Methylocalor cossyra]|uniref:MxaK protein n=1 Tax=Candidatus Methylocalor cossyra TaxID=3108543 RepID=A0ABM9NDX4_9GAMM